MEYNFNEKEFEYSKKDGKEIPVIKTSKYLETKKIVIDLLSNNTYKGLNESYFWILMNRTQNVKMAYTCLIISHDGMKVINDNLPEDKKVKSRCFSNPIKSEVGDGIYMIYQDDETYEIGEISKVNCMNAYPYAMLFKRTYDRVVKDKAKLYGVYSESEADEFAKVDEPVKEKEFITKEQFDELQTLYTKEELKGYMTLFKLNKMSEMKQSIATKLINERK